MELTIQPQARWNSKQALSSANVRNKCSSIIDNQESNKTLWYVVSMITQGVLFLPIPAAMIYYFNAPLFVLPITLVLFFGNIIAGMSGGGIRVILYLFLVSVLTHLVMLAYYLL